VTMLLGCVLSIWFPQKTKVRRVLLSPILDRILASELVETITMNQPMEGYNSTAIKDIENTQI